MPVNFLFDVGSEHTFTAPQAVLITSTLDPVLGPSLFHAFQGGLYGLPTADYPMSTQAFIAQITIGDNFSTTANQTSGEVAAIMATTQWSSKGTVPNVNGSHQVISLTQGGVTSQVCGHLATISIGPLTPQNVASVRGGRSDIKFGDGGVNPYNIPTIEGYTATVARGSNANATAGQITGYRTVLNSGAGGTPSNVTGLQIDAIAGNNATVIGVNIGNMTSGATANYAIKTGLGPCFWGDISLFQRGTAYKRTPFSNANLVVTNADAMIVQTGAMSASRTVTLPSAATCQPGQVMTIVDESGSVTGVNTIVVARSGADTINGAVSQTISTAYGCLRLMTDGASKWTLI